ncbi:MAG: transposase, partial [Synergistales bacterium]|nr:transposase [Synergistales bacterium]
MVFGIVKKDSIFCTFRDLILPLVREGDFASFYNLDKGRDSVSPALLSLAVILQRILGYSDREMALAVRVDLEVKYALGLPVLYDVGDPTMAPVLVDGVLSHGLDFSKAIGDTQYGSGKFCRLALSRGVRVSAPLFPKAQSASWIKEGVMYDPEAQTMTCP